MPITTAGTKDIDACITSGIGAGRVKAGTIEVWTYRVLADCGMRMTDKRPAFRTIDGRLQAMRRRGAICYVDGKWALVTKETPHDAD